MINRIVVAFALIGSLAGAYAEVSSETYCFTTGGVKPIKLELREYFDSETKNQFAFVKYSSSQNWIPAVLVGREEESSNGSGPATVSRSWIEIIGNKTAGTYELVSQGTELVSMTYKSPKTKKEISFVYEVNAFSDNGCVWK